MSKIKNKTKTIFFNFSGFFEKNSDSVKNKKIPKNARQKSLQNPNSSSPYPLQIPSLSPSLHAFFPADCPPENHPSLPATELQFIKYHKYEEKRGFHEFSGFYRQNEGILQFIPFLIVSKRKTSR